MTAPRLLGEFSELRASVQRQRIGDGGWDTCRRLTAALNAAVTELASGVVRDGVAVVAVGGYGRGELCLFSDVDVMLLHSGGDLGQMTGAVLYPLWDANLKVGHSVRTVEEAVEVAQTDFDTLTSLLTMRLIVGDGVLVDELETALTRCLKSPLTPELVAREVERRDVDPYPVMSADLKEGRGGLRTFQSVVWERRRAELLGISHDENSEPHAAYGQLLAARNALHAATGRAVDRFHVDVRSSAAQWLGVDVEDLASTVCAALHDGDRLVERRWPELVGQQPGESSWGGRSIFSKIRGRRISRARIEVGPEEPALRLALRLAAVQPAQWRDGPVETYLQRASWHKQPWTQDDRDAFVDLLQSGARGRAAWALLEELGWVANHLPEWEAVRNRPQLAPFHDHPVDVHLWRTVDEIISLSADPTDDRSGIAAEAGSLDQLVLAAFFHDLGKGRGRDHSEVGAEIARETLTRFGFDERLVHLVATVTRHHLLLSETAVRRDLGDPGVIDEIAIAVKDLHTLQVLYLLSIADAVATGSGMLTAWKASLLRTAYSRVAATFHDDPATYQTDVDAAIAAAPGRTPQEVVGHIEAMDPTYLFANTPEEIAWHLDLVAVLDVENAVGQQLAVRDAAHGSTVAVVANDRTGLLGDIATVFAVHGISILGARLFTRADGVAFDLFDVEDDRTHAAIDDDRWDRVRRDLAGSDEDATELRASLEARAAAYGGRAVGGDVSVRTPTATTMRHNVIEVRCGDRIGRLSEIVAALYSEELDISVAKLDTRAGHVLDTFYVTRAGRRIDNSAEILRTVTSIRNALRE